MNAPESALDIALSRIPQANYLTSTPAAAGPPKSFVEERVKQRGLPQITAETKTNQGYSGGMGFANESWKEGWSTDFKYALDFASQNIGRYLYAAMGGYAVSQPDAVGSPTVYKHTFTPLDRRTTVQLPAFSIVTQLMAAANGINSKFPSMVVDELSLASNAKARVEGNVAWTGSGEETKPSGVTWATHVQSQQNGLNYFYHAQSGMSIGTYPTKGGAYNYSVCDLLGWNFKITNEHAKDDYGCPRFKIANDLEKGVMRSHYLLQAQMFMLDFTLKLQTNSPERAALENGTALEMDLTLTGNVISGVYSHQLKIIMPLMKYNAVDVGFEGGFCTTKVTPDLLFSDSDNSILSIELTNNIASYAV